MRVLISTLAPNSMLRRWWISFSAQSLAGIKPLNASSRMTSTPTHTTTKAPSRLRSYLCVRIMWCVYPPGWPRAWGTWARCVCVRESPAPSHLIDPNTLQIAEVDGSTYWRNPFSSLCNPRQLVEFIVMDIDIIRDQKQKAGAGLRSNKHTLAELWVQKTSEMDMGQQYHCRTFLGHLLNIGDLVLGFDFANSNINDEFLNKMNPHHVPDVVLIKKSYDRSKRAKRRNWKLKEIEKDREGMDTDDERQYQDFLEDLEEDEALRKNINIFRDSSKVPVESDTDDEGAPRISLMEMLEDLSLSDATGGEGADMLTE
ncbi:hypothetical protein SKAU_G00088140 [Synaphobranchus kaupii]|uniref:60S ribosomal export protein NMD3 OB-fold domain-containing protein n=1 Tax=Synaphobranchus kaupii TaxID=118154 RepID=A0A9Q1FW53_SYNKA|nr:hypothetical protein SKAU_G00088140 [Synaphobranchus kaupii]